MSLLRLPTDLITEITKFLTFKESLNLRHAIGYMHLSSLYLFKNSQIFFKPLLLTSLLTDEKQLFEMMNYSSLHPHDVYDILYHIDQDVVTKDNKYNMQISYNVSDINNEKIKNSIKLVKLILNMIEQRIDQNNIINNPYCYLNTILNNLMIDYFTDVIVAKYNVSIKKQSTTMFRYMVYYEHALYTLNVNLYLLFLLYLVNLNIVPSKNLKKIRKDIKHGYHLINPCEDTAKIAHTNLLDLFNDNDAMAIAYKMLKQTDNKLYHKLVHSNRVNPFMKAYISR